MSRTINVPRDSIMILLEPNVHDNYSISVMINNKNKVIQFSTKQQKTVIDDLLRQDLKLTCAIIGADSNGNITVLKHSPQSDFF